MRILERFGLKVRVWESLNRIFVDLEKIFLTFPEEDLRSQLEGVLEKISGIKNFMFVYVFEDKLDLLADKIISLEDYKNRIMEAKSFRVRVKRSQKMNLNSEQLERKVGADLLKRGINLKVKMKNSDLVVWIEFFNNRSFVAFEKYKGLGGLTSNSIGTFVSLISSGVDSPVASFMMQRRGAKLVFCHFHSLPYSDEEDIEMVKEILKKLLPYQEKIYLYLFSLTEYQEKIVENLTIPDSYRTILYRRMMMKVAEKLLFKVGAVGLLTGDCLGQVASQTAKNLLAVSDIVNMPIYRPLISFDKEEVIKLSKKIDTFSLSIKKCKESCTIFSGSSPELAANLELLKEFEEAVGFDLFLGKIFEKGERIQIL